ncbi:hypothetical protein [Legionella bozemanae]|nr:hypothetical protein [Legionella bozemanae]
MSLITQEIQKQTKLSVLPNEIKKDIATKMLNKVKRVLENAYEFF